MTTFKLEIISRPGTKSIFFSPGAARARSAAEALTAGRAADQRVEKLIRKSLCREFLLLSKQIPAAPRRAPHFWNMCFFHCKNRHLVTLLSSRLDETRAKSPSTDFYDAKKHSAAPWRRRAGRQAFTETSVSRRRDVSFRKKWPFHVDETAGPPAVL